MASWIVRARGRRSERFEAMDALTVAGFDVEVSPRGTHYVSPKRGDVLSDKKHDRGDEQADESE